MKRFWIYFTTGLIPVGMTLLSILFLRGVDSFICKTATIIILGILWYLCIGFIVRNITNYRKQKIEWRKDKEKRRLWCVLHGECDDSDEFLRINRINPIDEWVAGFYWPIERK